MSPGTSALRALRTRIPRLGPSNTLGRVVAAVLLVAAGASSGAQLVTHQLDALPADAVFRIDGKVTTVDQLKNRISVLSGLYGIKAPKDAAKLDQFNRDTAKAIAVSQILEQAARDQGVVIAEKAANDQLGKLIRENFDGNRDAFIEALGQSGVSQRDVIDEIKRQLSSAELFSQITKDVKPATDQQVRDYYNEHQDELVAPEQRRISNIVVRERSAADRIKRLAESGQSFAELARAESLDGETKDRGGDLGFVTKDQVEGEYGVVAFSAARGAVFGPVEGEYGWNIGVVLRVRPAQPLALEEVSTDIANKLNGDAVIRTWQSWLSARIRAAEVEYADRYLPDDPNAAPATPSTS